MSRSTTVRVINDQALADAYQIRGSRLNGWVYDPNSPGDDGVVCAFVSRYVAMSPPQVV